MQATTPDVVILARNPDRAMACDFTKHMGAKLNNRDPNWGVVVFVLISSPDSPEGSPYGRRRRRKNLAKL